MDYKLLGYSTGKRLGRSNRTMRRKMDSLQVRLTATSQARKLKLDDDAVREEYVEAFQQGYWDANLLTQ